MSEENAHSYQAEVPVEQVETTSNDQISNAFAEKQTEETQQHVQEQSQEPQQQEPDEFASKFAALSRKEKDLRERERQMEQRIQEYEAKMQQLQQPEPEAKEPELPLDYRIKKNPIAELEKLGLTYEDLTQMVLNDGKPSTDLQLKLMREEIERDYESKYKQLEDRLLEKEKQEEEANYQTTLNTFKSEIKSHIDQSEEYELIREQDAYDLVYDVIQDFYNENGSILDTTEAAKQVENYLEEEARKLFEKSKKIKSWMQPQSSQPAPRQDSPTLSNSSAATGTYQTSNKLLSREDSIAQLAKQIKWND